MTEGAAAASPRIELDHLVVAARTLEEGVAWCEATLGVVPEPGGRHALMGTHNRLLALRSARYPRSYLEIVAIDPDAPAPGRARWFDLDAPWIQVAIAETPRLVHWVARTSAIDAATAAFRDAGHDAGISTPAERMTPRGLLRWRI
ncbi:MAG: VOC family protein, partial [Pseudomonadota bacterium]|nr:VOC family protein [Pseudomonadota bacterium]